MAFISLFSFNAKMLFLEQNNQFEQTWLWELAVPVVKSTYFYKGVRCTRSKMVFIDSFNFIANIWVVKDKKVFFFFAKIIYMCIQNFEEWASFSLVLQRHMTCNVENTFYSLTLYKEWSYPLRISLLEKSLMENFIFRAVKYLKTQKFENVLFN